MNSFVGILRITSAERPRVLAISLHLAEGRVRASNRSLIGLGMEQLCG